MRRCPIRSSCCTRRGISVGILAHTLYIHHSFAFTLSAADVAAGSNGAASPTVERGLDVPTARAAQSIRGYASRTSTKTTQDSSRNLSSNSTAKVLHAALASSLGRLGAEHQEEQLPSYSEGKLNVSSHPRIVLAALAADLEMGHGNGRVATSEQLGASMSAHRGLPAASGVIAIPMMAAMQPGVPAAFWPCRALFQFSMRSSPTSPMVIVFCLGALVVLATAVYIGAQLEYGRAASSERAAHLSQCRQQDCSRGAPMQFLQPTHADPGRYDARPWRNRGDRSRSSSFSPSSDRPPSTSSAVSHIRDPRYSSTGPPSPLECPQPLYRPGAA